MSIAKQQEILEGLISDGSRLIYSANMLSTDGPNTSPLLEEYFSWRTIVESFVEDSNSFVAATRLHEIPRHFDQRFFDLEVRLAFLTKGIREPDILVTEIIARTKAINEILRITDFTQSGSTQILTMYQQEEDHIVLTYNGISANEALNRRNQYVGIIEFVLKNNVTHSGEAYTIKNKEIWEYLVRRHKISPFDREPDPNKGANSIRLSISRHVKSINDALIRLFPENGAGIRLEVQPRGHASIRVVPI